MNNYVIHFQEQEREAILNILSRSNDIIINHVETTSVGITIQLEDSDQAYEALLDRIRIERERQATIIVQPKC